MSHYEYKAVPAPTSGEATSSAQTIAARISNAVETRLNAMAADGWSYVRADNFTTDGEQGTTTVLIFRRACDFGMFTEEKPEFGTFGDAAE
ncbi:DUF4177 domain-containing protein [Celeribacter sp.]|uniref:DUF4177 domain-containing protein n=1 Tax=Celeribacter sp. TaxID=1890673 RepID=UPI003A8F9D87